MSSCWQTVAVIAGVFMDELPHGLAAQKCSRRHAVSAALLRVGKCVWWLQPCVLSPVAGLHLLNVRVSS
jgi:hypothetical protein